MLHFSRRDGIENAYIFGLTQDRQGYLYLLTQRSLYFFSGQHFYKVKTQEIPGQDNSIETVRFLPDGRIVVLQHGLLKVTQRATSPRISPLLLRFHQIATDHIGFIRNLFTDEGRLVIADARGLHICNVSESDVLSCEGQVIQGSQKAQVYQIGDRVFYREPHGKILHDLSGLRVLNVSGHAEIANSPNSNAALGFYAFANAMLFAPHRDGTFSSLPIDWEIDRETIDERPTFLVEAADATVFFDGNRLRFYNGWYWSFLNYDLGREQDIHFAYVDRNDQLWTVQDLVELVKLIGWGTWENLEPQSIRSVWSVMPGEGRQLLLTEQGLYPLERNEIGERIRKGSFFFAIDDGASGYWMPADDQFLLHCHYWGLHFICDKTLRIRRIVDLARSSDGNTLWIASDEGLMEMAGRGEGSPVQARNESGQLLDRPASTVTRRDDGSAWAIIGGALYRRTGAGRWAPVITHWINGREFDPLTMVFSSHDDLWVGGIRAQAGLVHIRLAGDRVEKIDEIDARYTGSKIAFSLLWDSHKHLWVGTENGLAAYDGHSWIRLTKDDGLVSANINQQGLTEDRDGTIWITTTRGVSHLMHPEHLFEKSDLNPVFIQVRLGDRLLPEYAVPFSRDPLMITLGTLNTALSSTTYFRYRLEGVDRDWVTTRTGEIRYNFVPPGHTRLIVQAINDNRNIISKPIILEIRMQRPWWMAWPLVALYVVAVVALPYLLTLLRFRYLLKRQKLLETLVHERTTEMRAAQEALEQQARQDGLTRLMNRRTVEASVLRLLERLSLSDNSDKEDGNRSVTLALFDVDHFKSINDTFGHPIGDEVLAEIGARLLRDKLSHEIIGRYGGEEFLIVIEGSFAMTRRRIEALLQALTDTPFETKVGTLTIGCSAGIARTQAEIRTPGEAWTEALERADQALYRAKLDGRGRIVVSERDQDGGDYPD